jgi:carbamoyltransferase
MAYNILGININHNSSVALVSNGELIYYLEEERLSREKRDSSPFRSMFEILNKYPIDEVIICGTGEASEFNMLSFIKETPFISLVRKFNPYIQYQYLNKAHHITHASCAFYNSGFEKAIVIVIDGAGSFHEYPSLNSSGYEGESIYLAEYPDQFTPIIKNYVSINSEKQITLNNDKTKLNFSKKLNIGQSYSAVTKYLGGHFLDGGKTMGLSSYGKYNKNIPFLIKKGQGNNLFFDLDPPQDNIFNPIFFNLPKSSNSTFNQLNISQEEKDIAWKIQNDSQESVKYLIQKSLDELKLKKICLVGGYSLNCVTNYFLKRNFPDIEFYVEPISNDAGTSIGGAKLRWYQKSKENIIRKQTSLYLGPKYSKKQLKLIIKNYNNMFKVYDIKPESVAKLISENNIVTIFQGRSEAGPRALGNRSILYNPTDPNGKDFVNKVKKREWFRPFAGTVLLEKANEWFDMAGLEESPFMMYAMDVWPDKQEIIKAITHVDGTCRIQTVTEEQNPHYYKLIQEFEKITGVPILFNTSFNLAGDPLVETIEDALETMLKSDMKYMYVPELGYLLEKKDK